MSLTPDDVERPNPPRRGVKKGLYLIPSAFTAGNIGMGFLSVMESLRGFQLLGAGTPNLSAASEHFDRAAIAIGVALLFDMLDGRIARLTKTTTEIGVQLDSIADVVTFGLAPAVLEKAAQRLAFGAMTWPHMLARAMLLEQIYRAHTILTGHPYHRA